MTSKYNKLDLLRFIEHEFVRDFDFADVHRKLKEKGIFTEDECDEILQEKSNNDQTSHISKMFFILIYSKSERERELFMKIIEHEYDWLTELWNKINRSNERNNVIDVYLEALASSEIPKNRDLLVHRYEYLWKIQQKLKTLRRGEYLALIGNLGFGKRCLAADACHDLDVMRRMNYYIFWINVHKCKTNELILEKLLKLKIMIHFDEINGIANNYDTTNNEIFFVKKQIRKILDSEKYKECLLVLSGVQNVETLKAFDLLNCKILLTARSAKIMDNISNTLKSIISIRNGFKPRESEKLFSKALNRPILNEWERNRINDLHTLCKGHPFIMNLIAVNLVQFEYKPSTERWNNWIEILKKYQLNNEIIYPIEQTLLDLTIDQKTLFESLVIFTDNVNIPIKVLKRYWNKTEKDTEDIVNLFKKTSLLETDNLTDKDILVCSMHYIYYTYLTNKIDTKRKCTMHKTLIENYRIREALENRTEPDIKELPGDNYFYFYIGHHLKEAKMLEYFPLLFLDLGFLEEKLRVTGLPNTIGDLDLYRFEIIGSGSDSNERKDILDDLLVFLPNIEEMMIKSTDTCLLQYALNYSENLRKEAIKQALKFKNRAWMQDIDHTHKQRQIVQLPRNAHIVKFYDPNTCLICLDNSTILLKDLSSIYSVESTSYIGHKSRIIDIQILSNEHFLSLDKNGIVKVWSSKNTPTEKRRSDSELGRARQKEYKHFNQSNPYERSTIQEINNYYYRITCMNICYNSGVIFFGIEYNNNINCKVLIYQYNKHDKQMPLQFKSEMKTKFKRITNIIQILDKYLMVFNEYGNFSLYYKIDNGDVAYTERWTYNNFLNIHLCKRTSETNSFLFIYKNNIVFANFHKTQGEKLLETNYNDLTATIENFNDITCSTLTYDYNYLLIGTKKGVIVYDYIKKLEILRISISESILSLDTYLNDTSIYKYLLMTSTEKSNKIINIYGLIIEHELETTNYQTNELSLCERKQLYSTYLLGGKLFDFVYDNNNDEIILYAVDSTRKVHQKLSQSEYSQSMLTVQFDNKVTTISSISDRTLVGLDDGSIWNLIDKQLIEQLNLSINFLKCFNDDITVVGTVNSYKILPHANVYQGCVVDAHPLSTGYLVIVKMDCSFDVIKIDNNKKVIIHCDIGDDKYGSSDLIDNYLLLGTISSHVYIYEIDLNENLTKSVMGGSQITKTVSEITKVCFSPDKTIFAVGFKNGIIEVYEIETKVCIYHNSITKDSPIKELIFSPWIDSNSPLILISVSDSICFWDIKYTQNSQYDKKIGGDIFNGIRNSQRYNKKKIINITKNLKLLQLNGSSKRNSLINDNQWIGKIGASDKPELISCIKLVGNSAEKLYASNDFLKFLTIDDEGNIYYLRLLNLDNNNDNNNIIIINNNNNNNNKQNES